MKRTILAFAAVVAGLAFGTTRYVDCNLEDYTNHDGSSWAMAYKTIQEGVDSANLDDVVLVAPGWYDEGGATAGSGDAFLTNRVYISKRITIRSRDGRASRDSTFIVGRHATEPEDPLGMGMGLDAIRCVRFASDNNTYGATLEGFTLVNGATHYNAGNYARCSSGGGADFGANVTDESKAQYLVDCVISNCVATRGGGIYYGNAVRCLFVNNYANKNGAAVRNGNIYWCVLDGNWGSTGIAYLDNKKAVNCTGVNSISHSMFKGNNVGSEGFLYNCVALQHGTTSVAFTYPSNCVLAANVAYYSGNNSASGTSTNTCRLVGMDSLQFASTATGDLRPLTTGDLIGAGDAALLANIPEKYRYTDYDGNTVDPAKPLHAGAIQTPVEPKGGVLRFTSYSVHDQNTPGLTVDGHMLCADKLYSVALGETRVCRVECQMPLNPAKRFFGYAATLDDNSFTIYRFPKRGTAMAHIMAPRAGREVMVIPYVTENVLWTDPSVQDGAEMDGTEEHPYNTLQAAVDRATGTKGYWMVYAKKGRYDKGGALFGGLTNRVAFANDKTYINLYAVDGPEETFIVGAADGSSEHHYGYGDAAIRCVGSITGCATVNGFTLTGGRCKLNNGSEVNGTAGGYGGGAYSTTSTFQIEDCVITNCAASRGAVAWMAALRRCLVTDCTTTYIGALRGGVHASACVFKDIKKYRSGNSDYIVGQADLAYNCTFICNDTGDANICVNDNYSANGMYGSVVYGFSKIPYTPSSQICAYYYDNVGTVEPSAKTDARLTPCKIAFADAEAGDYALYSSSAPAAIGCDSTTFGDRYWAYGAAVDFEGTPFKFSADGRVTAGAYQRTVPSVSVIAAAEDSVGTVMPAGETFLTPDSPTVTFTADGAGERNFRGFYLDGELVTSGTSYSYAYSGAAPGTRLALEARYVPYWYVDPTKSDANSGCDWANAKRTLAGVMAKALPGDTVFAAPGVYNEGDMIQHVNSYSSKTNAILRSRVVVTNNVKLVSRDGPETTVIMGAESAQNLRNYGLGTDALRCVHLYPDAEVDGFTLSGGRSVGGTEYDDNNAGAGALGWYNSSGVYPTIRNCIVTNCVAERGGGIMHTRAVNCRFYCNRALNNSAAGIHARFVNCLFDYNHGKWVVGYWTEMRSCTIGAHNEGINIFGTSPTSGNVQTPYVYNTLVLVGRVNSGSSTDVRFVNCAFSTDMLASFTSATPLVTTNETCICVDRSQLQADADSVPVIGANLAIDAGDTNYLDLAEFPTDIAGRPRAVNGLKMDIGCHEADWKPRYAADLGARTTVTEASPAVCETAERTVELTDGTALSFALANPKGLKARQQVQFRVSGAGVLTLSIGGETRTFTDTGAVQTCEFVSTATSTALDFSFAGPGSAELVSANLNAGTTILFR